MVKIVNIVASGHIGKELDLAELASDIDAIDAKYQPEIFTALQLRYKDHRPVLMVYASGSYVIMGAQNEDQLSAIYERFCASLEKLNMMIDGFSHRPEIKNLICKDDLDQKIDLESLVLKLGFEKVEYEPEQSPFIYYWPDGFDCLMTIPANGEVIVTGVSDVEQANSAISHLRGIL